MKNLVGRDLNINTSYRVLSKTFIESGMFDTQGIDIEEYIEGRIKTRKWQDDKGNDRYSTEINCTEFTFLSNKNEDVVNSNDNVNQKPEIQQPKADVVDMDDDLPF